VIQMRDMIMMTFCLVCCCVATTLLSANIFAQNGRPRFGGPEDFLCAQYTPNAVAMYGKESTFLKVLPIPSDSHHDVGPEGWGGPELVATNDVADAAGRVSYHASCKRVTKEDSAVLQLEATSQASGRCAKRAYLKQGGGGRSDPTFVTTLSLPGDAADHWKLSASYDTQFQIKRNERCTISISIVGAVSQTLELKGAKGTVSSLKDLPRGNYFLTVSCSPDPQLTEEMKLAGSCFGDNRSTDEQGVNGPNEIESLRVSITVTKKK
jgi:hypothetical protein